jgi:hypothetical protein
MRLTGMDIPGVLALYQQIAEPYSIGWAHHRLARLTTGTEREAHVAAAREAWQRASAGRNWWRI